MDTWRLRLRAGDAFVLRTDVAVSAAGFTQADPAAMAGCELSVGTVSTCLGALLHNRLIEQRGDALIATDVSRGIL